MRPAASSYKDRMNAAYDDSDDDITAEQRRSQRVRFELIFASLGLAFGLFLLPALVFWVGAALLGAYGENSALSTFYVDFYGDLADGAGRVWALALGPLVLLYLLRAIFIGVRSKPVEKIDDDEPPYEPRRPAPPPRRAAPVRSEVRPEIRPEVRQEKSAPGRRSRVEPRMGAD